MVSAAKRAVGPARELRCEIDRKDGDIRAFATLIVVETVTDKQNEISLDSAQRFKPDAQLEEELEVEVTPKNFGRIVFRQGPNRSCRTKKPEDCSPTSLVRNRVDSLR